MLKIRCSDDDAARVKQYLTESECVVFDLRRDGKSRTQMAIMLHCSESTIRNRLRRIKGVINRMEYAS